MLDRQQHHIATIAPAFGDGPLHLDNAADAAKRPPDTQGSLTPLLVWLVIMGFLVLPLFRRRAFGRSGPVVLWGPGFGGGSSGGGSVGGFGGGGGGFSGGGGSFGGGGASGGW